MADSDQVKTKEPRNNSNDNFLTNNQRDEADGIAGIMRREIHKSGRFKDRLNQYAFTFALGQRFDQFRAEIILRDQYEAKYGEDMKQTLDGLLEREAVLRENGQDQALHHARSVCDMIQSGDTMPFYRAYDNAAVSMAEQHGITESGAKSLMKAAFRETEGRELYDVGQDLQKEFHEPKREAARLARTAKQDQKPEQVLSRTR